MKAVILKDIGEYEIVERPIPKISDPTELLVKIEASSICGSDVHIFGNPPGIEAVKGTIIGHEMVAKVVEIGSEVSDLKVGDRVVIDNNISCTHCFHCRSGHPNMCSNMRTKGVDLDGNFAEYMTAPERVTVKIPDDMPIETAIFAEPLNCVMGAVDKIRLLPGETVLIMGAGPIGLYFIKLLSANGAGKIFVTEMFETRARYAKECGAARVINPAKENLNEIILRETGGIGVDVSVDAVGTLLPDCITNTRCNGRILLFGNNASVKETICQADVTRKELTIMGSYIGPHTLQQTIQFLASGAIDLGNLITHKITLSEFGTGLEAMRKGEAIEVVIYPDKTD